MSQRVVASARHPSWVACAAGGRGQGLASPLPPTTPIPVLGQPSLAGIRRAAALLCSSLCRASEGIALPLSRAGLGTSVRAASELPPRRGGDLLRAMTR